MSACEQCGNLLFAGRCLVCSRTQALDTATQMREDTPMADEFDTHLRRRAAQRPRGAGFVGSQEGSVVALNDDGTIDFREKRTGRTVTVLDERFHSSYAANH